MTSTATTVCSDFEIAIVGGGLAGMTLALQLKQMSPELAIVVLERNNYPPPVAAHKVGESTVEIGAHYLSDTLGLRHLLESNQLRKFGLRFFFGSGKHDDLAQADELGASEYLPVISYQLDRGRLEGDLAELLKSRGIELMTGCFVRQVAVAVGGGSHELQVMHGDQTMTVKCRWVIDAASRFGLLKRHLNLGQKSQHQVNSAWLRLDSSIDVDAWSNSHDWSERCNGLPRRLSTNHLMGAGYWAWIIPLAENRTSIGLVADPTVHAFSSFNNFDRFLNWLTENQPALAGKLKDSEDSLMDFKYLKNLSHDCKKVWSDERWALTGESGVFADPYYSPGTDFIAISNTFLCDLIAKKRSDPMFFIHSEVYQKMYKSFFDSTMSLYEQQYPGFGESRLMVVKSTWDYAYYWLVLAWLYFREVMTDITFIRSIEADLNRMRTLNLSVQSRFRNRAAQKRESQGSGRFFDQIAIPVLVESNAALLNPTGSLQQEFKENCKRLEGLAPLLLKLLNNDDAGISHQCSLLGDLRSRFS